MHYRYADALCYARLAIAVLLVLSLMAGAVFGFDAYGFALGLLVVGLIAGFANPVFVPRSPAVRDFDCNAKTLATDILFLLGVAGGFAFLPVPWAWALVAGYVVLVGAALLAHSVSGSEVVYWASVIMVGIAAVLVMLPAPLYVNAWEPGRLDGLTYVLACVPPLGYAFIVILRLRYYAEL